MSRRKNRNLGRFAWPQGKDAPPCRQSRVPTILLLAILALTLASTPFTIWDRWNVREQQLNSALNTLSSSTADDDTRRSAVGRLMLSQITILSALEGTARSDYDQASQEAKGAIWQTVRIVIRGLLERAESPGPEGDEARATLDRIRKLLEDK